MINFYRNKKVMITGHTGFKGSWICQVLSLIGAEVVGYSMDVPTTPALFNVCGVKDRISSIKGDVRDLAHLKEVMERFEPEIIIHMAAQPIVRVSYTDPVFTYETNVMGTVNVLEAVRNSESVKSVINVTTDKVYKNREWQWGYREIDELNGFDPYSNSKSCSELVTESYNNSFFKDRDIAVSTCRAGNVIGGGDFAVDRIIPDCYRAAEQDGKIIVRNPYSVRPYQHVLEPVMAYLMIAMEQYMDANKAGAYNIGPTDSSCLTTGELVSLFCSKWNEINDSDLHWECVNNEGPHEANFLKLDCSKVQSLFSWEPKWDIEVSVEKVVEWYSAWKKGADISRIMAEQIKEYMDA